jgi:hypothetical protein
MRRWLAAAAAWALDACLWLVLVGIVVVLVTGGGQARVAGVLIRARSLGNPLLAFGVLLAIRYLLAGVPLLGLRGRTPWDVADACRRLLDRGRALLDGLTGRHATRVLAVAVVLATAVRVANVVVHFGFITGDDVEIHEMTLGTALGYRWPVWDLRSAFFPMVFIYPAQKLLIALGVSDIFTLVLAGRLVVTAIAALNIVLVYHVGVRLFGARGKALIAAILFALNHLHMAYGGAELPRVVATAFIVAAFGVSLRPTMARSLLAGALLGIGAALRFGEIVFLAPAVVSIVVWGATTAETRTNWATRAMAAFLLSAACLGTAAAILLTADWLYWGDPLQSVIAMVDYTLVRRLSSRGYEPVWHYLADVASWSHVALVGLAVAAAGRGGGRPLTWAVLPVAALSLLPHKEARYVIATIPFWSLAAASGLWWCAESLAAASDARRARGAALALVVLVIGGGLYDASRYRFRRSEDSVRLAWTIAATDGRGVAADQLWRFGGRLYLSRAERLIDLDPAFADDETGARAAFCRHDISWVALRSDRVTEARTRALTACGLAPVPSPPEAGYAVFRKAAP